MTSPLLTRRRFLAAGSLAAVGGAAALGRLARDRQPALIAVTFDLEMSRNFPTDQMRELNRSAIVVRPKQPFLEWLHSVDPTSSELTLQDLGQEPDVYLVPEFESEEDLADCLREMFRIRTTNPG